jgi:hypothetical protein
MATHRCWVGVPSRASSASSGSGTSTFDERTLQTVPSQAVGRFGSRSEPAIVGRSSREWLGVCCAGARTSSSGGGVERKLWSEIVE